MSRQECFSQSVAPYWSCPFIESALVFTLGHLSLCCITNHGMGCTRVENYDGGEVPLDRILSYREEVRTANQKKERYPLCAGCGYLEKKVWPRDPYPFRQLLIAHFTRCNLRCGYCYILKHGHLDNPYQPCDLAPVLKSMLDNSLLSPRATVSWGGGEPVLYEDFEGTFRLLLDHGLYQDVNTNGTVMSPLLKEALSRGKARITCGVDAGTAETYKKIKGRDCFDAVWRNLAEYAKTGGDVAAKMIVMRDNCHEVVPFVRKARDAGVSSIAYDVNYFNLEPSDDVVEAIALLIKEATADRGMQVGEGGGGIPSFGEELRARIRGSMDRAVTWDEFTAQRKRIEDLGQTAASLKEQVEHLEQSRAVRLSRGLRKRHPLLMQALLRWAAWLEKARK